MAISYNHRLIYHEKQRHVTVHGHFALPVSVCG